jgi:hypothetical protein
MRVPARVFADRELLAEIVADRSLEQLQNVATLPGIVGAALAIPDIHQGYGFPVGGVAATEPPDGVVSPGGVGYDINCGMRLLALPLTADELGGRAEALVNEISRRVPVGAGHGGALRLGGPALDRALAAGPRALHVEHGIGTPDDVEHTESAGCLDWADPAGGEQGHDRKEAPHTGKLTRAEHPAIRDKPQPLRGLAHHRERAAPTAVGFALLPARAAASRLQATRPCKRRARVNSRSVRAPAWRVAAWPCGVMNPPPSPVAGAPCAPTR